MIRPATFSDCTRVFRLCCCVKGVQIPYPTFARVFKERLADEHELSFVAEDDSELVGYVSLCLDPANSVDSRAAISSLVVSPRKRGMRTFIMLQACRIADAMMSIASPPSARYSMSA